jgi:cysteinyl-tRNA synthetase
MSHRLILATLFMALAFAPVASLGQSQPKGQARVQAGQWAKGDVRPAAARTPDKILAQNLAQAPAQPRGQTRIQGRVVAEPEAPLPAPTGLQIDLRNQMRQFIQSITAFARRYNRNFSIITHGALELLIKRDVVDYNRNSSIITHGALELLIKRDVVDETRFAAARTYMKTIDGVMIDGLFFGDRVFGEPIADDIRARNLRLTGIAKNNGLPVLVMDYGTDHKTIDESYRLNREKGFVSITVHAPLAELGSLPPYPKRPFGEDSKSSLSLKDVATFAYITNSAAYGRQSEFAMKMHGTNYDLMIVDVLHGRKPLSKRAVQTLKYKKIGGRRMVFATANIGAAASYRYYWKSTWREGSPDWIRSPMRDDPDSHYVQFWRPEWQRIISGDTKSYIYGLVALGFDGVVLEGMEDAYRFFETGGEEEEETPAAPVAAQAPAPAPAAQ